MIPSFCSLAAVAAVVTTLASAGDFSVTIALEPGRIEVALTGPDYRPLSSDGATGKALLAVNGMLLGVALLPAGGNLLVGPAPFQPSDAVAAEIVVIRDGEKVTATASN